MACAIVVVLRFGIGTAMQYLLKLSCFVRIWRFPLGVIVSFPTVSRDTFLNGSAAVSVMSKDFPVRARMSFCSKQLLQPRINSVI